MKSACDNFERGFVNALLQHGFNEPFLYAYTLRVSDMVGSAGYRHVQNRIDFIIR
jgi:hypothetical protein